MSIDPICNLLCWDGGGSVHTTLFTQEYEPVVISSALVFGDLVVRHT